MTVFGWAATSLALSGATLSVVADAAIAEAIPATMMPDATSEVSPPIDGALPITIVAPPQAPEPIAPMAVAPPVPDFVIPELSSRIESSVPVAAEPAAVEPVAAPIAESRSPGRPVAELRDIRPQDWAYQALRSLIDRHGCIAGDPTGRFRGNQALTRYEFAAALNACVDTLNQRLTDLKAERPSREDLDILQALTNTLRDELRDLRGRLTPLVAQTQTLANQNFSETTKLYGQAIVGLQGGNSNRVDLFPEDGNPERRGQAQATLGAQVELSLATSFTGRDLLLTSLQSGNIAPSSASRQSNMARLSYEGDTANQVVLSNLSYRFSIGRNLGILVGSAGVDPINAFRGISPTEDSGTGALSLLGQRNPILSLGNTTGGLAFDWQLSRRVSLQGVYSAELPGLANRQGGLFGGRRTIGTQLTIAPTRDLDLGLNYLYGRSPDGFLGSAIGDAELLSPFAPAAALRTHAVGGTIAWRPKPDWSIGGWAGWTSSRGSGLSGSVTTQNWMLFGTKRDWFRSGDLTGLLIGQPPKITQSSLPVGYNFPNFSDIGQKGGRRDSALHLELFHRLPLSENLSITPGLMVVLNPNHNAANDAIVVGSVRTTLRF
jgi:Carbohydrate-selective porin, OprB family/S-layer homology domain